MSTAIRRAVLLLSATAAPAFAQSITNSTVIVTPGTQTALGWGLATGTRQAFDGGTSAITSTNPQSGTGSIELNIPAGPTRSGFGYGLPTQVDGGAAVICAATATCSRLGALSSLNTLKFDLFTPSVGGSSPVFRLYFTLSNPSNTAFTSFGSFIWNGAGNPALPTGQWNTVDLFTQNVSFRPVFRTAANVPGQVATSCDNNDRSDGTQTIAFWLGACSGVGSVLGLGSAQVLGWDVGQGNDGNPDARVGFADNISVGFDGDETATSTTWNFEADTNVVPEPSTYALMAAGLAGLVGIARRRRSTAK